MKSKRYSFRCRGAGSAVILTWSLLLSSCGQYEIQTSSELTELDRTTIPTLIMVTPQLVIEHEPYQTYQYAADVVEQLTREGRIPVVAPWEYDPEGELDASSAPQVALMALSDQTEVSLTDLAILELTVEGAYTSTAVRTPIEMGGGLEHHYRSDVTVRLTVSRFPYGEELSRVVVRFEDDPLSPDATAADPHPVVREGIREACDELVDLLDDAFGDPPDLDLSDLDLLANHRLMFTYAAGTDHSLADDLESMQELDRLVAEHVYYQYFDPDISGGTLRLFASTEPGILVQRVDGPYAELLEEGDYITEVGGVEAAGIQVLYRPFLLSSSGQTVDVSVLRGGRIQRIRLPV